jgi:hypothetical protein
LKSSKNECDPGTLPREVRLGIGGRAVLLARRVLCSSAAAAETALSLRNVLRLIRFSDDEINAGLIVSHKFSIVYAQIKYKKD